jgi:hypothetical protein
VVSRGTIEPSCVHQETFKGTGDATHVRPSMVRHGKSLVRQTIRRSRAFAERRVLLMKRFTIAADAAGALAMAVLSTSGVAAMPPSGFANFDNAQAPGNALTGAGYDVQINGGKASPLSSCKVVQVEGLNNSNIDGSGRKIDPTKLTPCTSTSPGADDNSVQAWPSLAS